MMGIKRKILTLILAIMMIASACQRSITAVSVASQAPTPVEVSQLSLEIPEDILNGVYHGLRNPETVFDVYRRQDFAPLWMEKAVLSPKSDSLVYMVRSARR